MPYYYGFDWTYIVLVLPCVILSLWASANVNSTFKRYSQQYSRRGSPEPRPQPRYSLPTVSPVCGSNASAAI